MHTPSLSRRVVRGGVAIVAAVVVLFGIVVWTLVRSQLHANLDEALALRTSIAVDLASRTPDAQDLADALVALGIPATVLDPQGQAVTASPAVVRSRPGEALLLSADPRNLVVATTELSDGRSIAVRASRAGTDEALRRLAQVLVVGALAAIAAAYVLSRRSARVTLKPLDEVVAAAQRTALGTSGERLHPDDAATELGKLAVAYDAMLDRLESAVEVAEASDEQSRRFLADAAHQLRTPLATIRAGVELLVIDPDPELRDQHLTNLIRETSRATRVLQSLMTLARLDRGRPSRRDPVDLGAIGDEEADRARSLAPGLEVACARSTSTVMVVGDADELREALANLLDNARRHAVRSIEISIDVSDGMGRIRVIDDGPGIPPEARNLVFERFATLDGKGGSGLGLPIARAIARNQRGDLTYEDGFVLTVPALADG